MKVSATVVLKGILLGTLVVECWMRTQSLQMVREVVVRGATAGVITVARHLAEVDNRLQLRNIVSSKGLADLVGLHISINETRCH